jgi:hypothetical protein
MCKPHKEIAGDIATVGSVLEAPNYDIPRSADNRFDPARYCVAMVAISTFRIEQVMPALYDNSCYDPLTLVTPEAKEALAKAELPVNKSCIHSTLKGIKAYRDEHIETLRAALDDTASYLKGSGSDLTLDGLGMPALPDDPTDNGVVLDDAVVNFYTGYDDEAMEYASKPLTLTSKAHKPEFEKLHEAVAYFLAQEGVRDVLKQMFENKMVEIVRKAPDEVKAGRGQQISCHMCNHTEPSEPGMS